MALKRNEAQNLSISAIHIRRATRLGRIEILKGEVRLLEKVLAEKEKEEDEEHTKKKVE